MNEKVRARLFISGRVQGVYFREKTKLKAQEFNVFGWVKNISDRRVEAVFEGEKDNVEKLIEWAKKGPFWAKVSGVDIGWQKYKGEFNNFEIKY